MESVAEEALSSRLKKLIAEPQPLTATRGNEELIIIHSCSKEDISARLDDGHGKAGKYIYFVSSQLYEARKSTIPIWKVGVSLLSAKPRTAIKGHIWQDFIVERSEESLRSRNELMEEPGRYYTEPWDVVQRCRVCIDRLRGRFGLPGEIISDNESGSVIIHLKIGLVSQEKEIKARLDEKSTGLASHEIQLCPMATTVIMIQSSNEENHFSLTLRHGSRSSGEDRHAQTLGRRR
ncbi:hypothetical protein Tco_0835126 [Tanacetum coccineum]